MYVHGTFTVFSPNSMTIVIELSQSRSSVGLRGQMYFEIHRLLLNPESSYKKNWDKKKTAQQKQKSVKVKRGYQAVKTKENKIRDPELWKNTFMEQDDRVKEHGN